MNKTLVLTIAETKRLKENGMVEIRRSGFDITVEYDEYNPENKYIITIINPYEEVLESEVK